MNKPILLLIFNRLDEVQKTFEQIKLVKPKRFYIAGDAARLSVQGEDKLVEDVRNWVLSNIDWECEIKTRFNDVNRGSAFINEHISWFFEHEKSGIILEDDVVADPSFFYFCDELLDKYENNKNIWNITGSQFVNDYVNQNSYFWGFISFCGWATWADRWQKFENNLDEYDERHVIEYFDKFSIQAKQFWISHLNQFKRHEVEDWDGKWAFSIMKHGGISINSSKNLVSNIGSIGTHFDGTSNCPFLNLPTSSIDKLEHPKFLELDIKQIEKHLEIVFGIKKQTEESQETEQGVHCLRIRLKKFFVACICLFIPIKKIRKKVRNYMLNNYADVINSNFKQKLRSIRLELKSNPNKKIRVGFLINDNAKWCVQSLYDELENDNKFEPIVLITIADTQIFDTAMKNEIDLKVNYDFFKSRNMNVEFAYEIINKKFISLSSFSLDIVFYQQPWNIDKTQDPAVVSKDSLTCYCPSGFQPLVNETNYKLEFHQNLWKYFVDIKENIKRFEKQHNKKLKNCIYLGYPKLDVYFDKVNVKKTSDKICIIYAPHHSINQFSTFDKTGKFMLDLAKRNPNINWIFKPHPTLKYNLILFKIMSEQEIDEYFESWNQIGKVYFDGDYFDLFNASDCLITDCISFLGEYLPTKKPIIHLINPKCPMEFNSYGKKIIEHFYKVYDNAELEDVFQRVVINADDYLKKERINDIAYVFDCGEKSASKIVKYIKKELRID